MVISVLSSQDTEFFKDNPSPVYTFVVYVTKMVDITPPQGEETDCQLVVMKYKRALKWNDVI